MTQPVRLVKFTAKWCGPCKRIGPAVDNLCSVNGIELEAVDIDENPDMAADASIQSVPTFIVYNVLGEELWRGSGATSIGELASVVKR